MLDSNPPKVNYAAHDIAYKRNRDAGLPGWNSAEEIAEHISQLSRIFSRSDIPKTGLVLDIGCGAGNISFWLESLGYNVTGIDVSIVAIDWAIEQAALTNSKARFSVIDTARNNYAAEEQFNLVLDNHCLHCIIGKDRELYLSNISNNLKSGGVYICNTMCDEIGDPDVLKYFDTDSRYYIRNNLAIRYIGFHDDIINEIKAVGLKIIQVDLTPDDTQDSMCIIAQKHMQ